MALYEPFKADMFYDSEAILLMAVVLCASCESQNKQRLFTYTNQQVDFF
jgi:hypothetical protein